MEYYLEEHGLTVVLFLKGSLSYKDAEELGSLIHKVIGDTSGPVVVDLGEVDQMDAAVAGQFVAAHREAKVRRREFVLSNISPAVDRIVRGAHVGNIVHIYRSTQEAIAELSMNNLGGGQRKVVSNIKCEHPDCVFYTYTKFYEMVVPACSYAYPDEISNGPNCRCYRVNWNQHKWSSQAIESPFQKVKKKSLYEVRDKAAAEAKAHAEEHHEEDLELSSEFEEGPIETVEKSGSLPPAWVTEMFRRESQVDLPVDPFADDNFPSAQVPVEPPRPEPVRHPSPPPQAHAPAPPVAAPPSPPPAPALGPQDIKLLKPDEVVRQYLSAWNEGRFGMEYECLSRKGHQLMREDYCERRKAVRAQQIHTFGKVTVQEIARVDSVAIEGDHAHVEITRVDRTPTGSRCYEQTFSLIKEKDSWKIVKSEIGEERKNPISPPKNRTMKATDFMGRETQIKKRPQH